MNNRASRLVGLMSTMRKLEDVAHAESHARRDEADRARRRARQAHATAAAAKSCAGSVETFLSSRVAGQLAADSASFLDDEAAMADQTAHDAAEVLREAKVRSAAFERLLTDAREAHQDALDAVDASVVEDMVAARFAAKAGDLDVMGGL